MGALDLIARARNVTSQFGEDGIIEAILERLPPRVGWCVDVGAWDGYHFSNTYNLIVNHASRSVLFEADRSRFVQLQTRYAANPRVVPRHAMVGFGSGDGLDALLAGTLIPKDYDVLSIDIDGNDYHVWRATTAYRPRVVLVEYNPTIPNCVEFVQEPAAGVTHGCGIRSLVALGREKGYELAAVTFANAVFVSSEYFGALGVSDNAIATLRPDEPGVTFLFSGYDGRVFLRGCRRLLWHDLDIDERRAQQLPGWLRSCPAQYGRVRRLLGRLYLAWRRRATPPAATRY